MTHINGRPDPNLDGHVEAVMRLEQCKRDEAVKILRHAQVAFDRGFDVGEKTAQYQIRDALGLED